MLKKSSIGALVKLICNASLVPRALGTISPRSKTRMVRPIENMGIKYPILF